VIREIPGCAAAALLFALALTGQGAGAANTHYKWLDERGNPVHSDRPPPKGIDYEVVSTYSDVIREVDAEEGAVPAEINPRVGNEFEQVDTGEQMQVMKKNPEYCKRAQENLQTLNTAARIRLRDEQGEFRFLTEEEKAAQRRSAEELISVHCDQ